MGQELEAALLKVTAALPETRRKEQQAARQRIHLDASWWGQSGQPGPHLGTVQQSVWQERALRLVTRTIFGAEIEQVVEPLGLVAKANEWYLVGLRGRPHVYRVASLVQAEVLAQPVQRPPDFDLAAYWERYTTQVQAERGSFGCAPASRPSWRRIFGFILASGAPAPGRGRPAGRRWVARGAAALRQPGTGPRAHPGPRRGRPRAGTAAAA